MTVAVPAQNASTLILVRPGDDGGLEVLLNRRPVAMRFLGGFYVFPGGSVKGEDVTEGVLKRCPGLPLQEAQRRLGANLSPKLALGHWVAAIRELYEETGILLCVDERGNSIDARDADVKRHLVETYPRLVDQTVSLETLLKSASWFCDVSHVAYFSHWQTPEEFPMRFDTRFFLAHQPQGQVPLFRSREVTESLWLSPDRALALYREGKLPIIFPTYATLRTLADFGSVPNLCTEYRLL
jgi:8-oxo-dGTP pyrophosphatase MutT (NUDIX family)